MPLFATSAWIAPFAAAAAAKAASTAARSRMSVCCTNAPPISSAVWCSASTPRAKRLSVAPSRARRCAIAFPMPRPAPVTTMWRLMPPRLAAVVRVRDSEPRVAHADLNRAEAARRNDGGDAIAAVHVRVRERAGECVARGTDQLHVHRAGDDRTPLLVAQ